MRFIIFTLFFLCFTYVRSQHWIWAKANDHCYGGGEAMVFDKVGNLYVTGFQDTATFIEKFDPTGDSLWMKNIGIGITALGITIDDSAIYLAGKGYNDESSFIVKTDLNGNIIWKIINTAPQSWHTQIANSIAVDSYGNVYVTGVFQDSVKFGNCVLKNTSETDFLVKLSPQGSCQWCQIISGGTYGHLPFVTIDDNDGVILATPDSIIKYYNDQVVWVKHAQELKSMWHVRISEANLDSVNNIYFHVDGDSVLFDSTLYKISQGHSLLVKLAPNGSLLLAKEIPVVISQFFCVGKEIYLTNFYDTRIEKLSLAGDSLWTIKLWCEPHVYNFNIHNIAAFQKENIIAITGSAYDTIKTGADSVLFVSKRIAPFVAAFKDVEEPLSVIESPLREDILIYPNPTAGILNVQIADLPSNGKIILLDILGNRVLEKPFARPREQIDLSGQPVGIYFVKVHTGNDRIVRKISIQ